MTRTCRKKRKDTNIDINEIVLKALLITVAVVGVYKTGECIGNWLVNQIQSNKTEQAQVQTAQTEQKKEPKVIKVSHQQQEVPTDNDKTKQR